MRKTQAQLDIPLSDAERADLLLAAIAYEVSRCGARVESQSSLSAVLVYGRPVNHILHLLLTIVTFGFWLLIWVLAAACNNERRLFVRVDLYGNMVVD